MSKGKREHRIWGALAGLLVLMGLLWLGFSYYRHKGQSDPFAEARLAYERGDWSKAAELARSRLKVVGNDAGALRLLARSSIRLGRDGTGAGIYAERLHREGMEAEDHFLLGVAFSREGNEEKALQQWTIAAEMPPEQPEMLLELANLLSRRQRLDESLEFGRRLSLVPGWEAQGLLMQGLNRYSLGDHAAAVDSLKKGLELDPAARRCPRPASFYRRILASSLLTLGRPEEADRWLEPTTAVASAGDGDATEPFGAWLSSRSALQQGKFERARSDLARSGSFRAGNSLTPEPSPYAGSIRCGVCHSEIVKQHDQTRHARTFRRGDELLSLPRPSGPLRDPDNPRVTHVLAQKGTKLEVETKVDDRVYSMVVAYAFGTPDRYVSMVGRDSEGGFRALRLSYFHAGGESGWGRTSGDVGGGDDVDHLRGQLIHVRDGVVRCLHCHVTNPRQFRDPDKVGAGPEAADAGIGCERCHGPGVNHIRAEESDFPDHAIINPGPVSAAAVTNQCKDCHIVGDASEIEHRREEPIWVRSPGATMGFSRCYTESAGAFSCVTCHDPHRDAERSALHYERKCLSCHSSAEKPKGNQSPSQTVCKVNPTEKCLGCHMPKVPVPVLHTSLTDHYIRIHREPGVNSVENKTPAEANKKAQRP